MTKELPSPELLRNLLKYDPQTGEFIWKDRPPESFANYVVQSSFAKRFAGKTAGSKNKLGYVLIGVNGRQYLAHRLAWVIFYGDWPKGQVDHINGVTWDNRIENLRDATPEQNHQNMKLFSNSTSGFTGVSWIPRLKKWRATISIGGRQRHLGVFAKKEEAVFARSEANKQHGFHKNHGRKGAGKYE